MRFLYLKGRILRLYLLYIKHQNGPSKNLGHIKLTSIKNSHRGLEIPKIRQLL